MDCHNRYILIASLLFFCHAVSSAVGSVILLNGTSSAGKTSISQELIKILPENWVAISLDDVMIPAFIAEGKRLGFITDEMSLEQQYAQVAEHRSAIYVEFDRTNWVQPLRMLNNLVRQTALSGKSVVFDNILGTLDDSDVADFYDSMQGIEVYSVLVYCSPAYLVHHVITRNHGASFGENRNILNPLKQFCCLYTTQDIQTVDSITSLSNKEVEYALHAAADHLFLTKPASDIHESIGNVRANYRATFTGLEHDATLYVASRLPHDFVVRCDVYTPKQCAHRICNFLQLP